MKKTLFAVLLILVCCSVAFAAIKDSPDGFRGIKWGEPPSALGGHTLIETQNEGGAVLSMYTRHNESMSIGKASLSKIIYFFYDNEFASVSILPEVINDHYHQLYMAFMTRYGKPDLDEKLDNHTHFYKWEDDDVLILYYSSYDTARVLANAFGMISSKHIAEKYGAKSQEYIKKDF